MSETTAAPAATENTEPTTQGDPADKPLGPNGEKALESERAARKAAEKSAADLAAKLKAIEDANLSEIEKAQKAAADARAELDRISKENLRNSVALAKGVPADLVQFLNGDTEDDLNAQADTLLARLNAAPTTPKPDLSQASTAGEPGRPLPLNGDPLEAALRAKLGAA
jgi:uncharacterized protein (DUF885 family)